MKFHKQQTFLKSLKWKSNVAKEHHTASLISMEDINAIFSNIETIYEFNIDLLAQLQERVKVSQNIADIFLSLVRIFMSSHSKILMFIRKRHHSLHYIYNIVTITRTPIQY